MKSKIIAFSSFLLLSSISIQSPHANAWDVTDKKTSSGSKQFILETYFQTGSGTNHVKRPTGAHKQLAVACTAGYFEVGFFDLSARGTLNVIGKATKLEVKIPATGESTFFAVNTKKGTDYVSVTNPKDLFRKMKIGKDMYVQITADGLRVYRARFSLQDINKFLTNLAAAGCKV
jgi:hypothetical protein